MNQRRQRRSTALAAHVLGPLEAQTIKKRRKEVAAVVAVRSLASLKIGPIEK